MCLCLAVKYGPNWAAWCEITRRASLFDPDCGTQSGWTCIGFQNQKDNNAVQVLRAEELLMGVFYPLNQTVLHI